jgi:hypothetical protein
MLARLRPHLPAALGALLGLAVIAWLGLVDWAWSDYDSEASAAVGALGRLDLASFAAHAPGYAGSLLIRAPFAVLPHAWGGGGLAVYRSMAAPCLLAAGGLAVWLAARMRADGHTTLSRAVAVGLLVASPVAERALELGHPEELLGAVLCVAALVAALGARPVLVGAFLGLAVANKMWALVAVGPVLAALPAERVKAALMAAVVAGAVYAPLAALHPAGAGGVAAGGSATGVIFQPQQAWWFLGDAHTAVLDSGGHPRAGFRAAPEWLSALPHPLIILAAVALTGLWLLRRRRAGAQHGDELLLLALVLHVRCLLDPWNNVYYPLPFLAALLAWETLGRRRPPVFTLLATVAVWLVFEELPQHGVAPDTRSAVYLALALPAAALMALRLLAPERLRSDTGPEAQPMFRNTAPAVDQ